MSQNETKNLHFIRTNHLGRPIVQYVMVSKTCFLIVCKLVEDEGVWVLREFITDRTKAYQLRNRIAGKGCIDESYWVRLEKNENTFQIQK